MFSPTQKTQALLALNDPEAFTILHPGLKLVDSSIQ